jgi:hypothetical protein
MTGHPGREEPDQPLEGLGAFAWRISLATAVAVLAVGLVLLVRGGRAEQPRPSTTSSGSPPPGTIPAAQPSTIRDPGDDRAESEAGRDVDRRHAAGELSEARRKFEPCRGGDVRRVAWIDPQQRVRKLVQIRANGLVLAQWFDEEGRVREALVRTSAGGREWTRRVTVDERGRAAVVDAPPGATPDEPPPVLLRGDASSAFFAGPGCEG